MEEERLSFLSLLSLPPSLSLSFSLVERCRRWECKVDSLSLGRSFDDREDRWVAEGG